MSNLPEAMAVQENTFNNDQVKKEARLNELKNPEPKCPRCGRVIIKNLIHLVSPDHVVHTFLCGHEKCATVISMQIDFMTMHMNAAQEQMQSGLIVNPNQMGAMPSMIPGGGVPNLNLSGIITP